MPKKTKKLKSSRVDFAGTKSSDFRERVHSVVRSIAKGSVMSYGEVALAAGSPGAARAVGTILRANFDPSIPCHRVIRANGTLGRYNRGDERKAAILREEGYHNDYEKNSKKS
jgi:O-6-methylguanine DNA methyltransferase